jgi:hypothetical protein
MVDYFLYTVTLVLVDKVWTKSQTVLREYSSAQAR